MLFRPPWLRKALVLGWPRWQEAWWIIFCLPCVTLISNFRHGTLFAGLFPNYLQFQQKILQIDAPSAVSHCCWQLCEVVGQFTVRKRCGYHFNSILNKMPVCTSLKEFQCKLLPLHLAFHTSIMFQHLQPWLTKVLHHNIKMLYILHYWQRKVACALIN